MVSLNFTFSPNGSQSHLSGSKKNTRNMFFPGSSSGTPFGPSGSDRGAIVPNFPNYNSGPPGPSPPRPDRNTIVPKNNSDPKYTLQNNVSTIDPSIFQTNITNSSLTEKGQTRLCGFPGFCAGSTSDIYNKCSNTTLLACQECGVGRASVFLLLVICLMLAIIIGNILIICVVYKRQKQHKASKIDICRGSLAAADFITGVQMLVVIIYNFSWSINLTPLELDAQQLTLRGSTQATVAGILFAFGYLSSLYHLVYMSIIRLFAVAKPIGYRHLSKRWVQFGLVAIWIFSFIIAAHPIWFPQTFLYTYYTSTFLFDSTVTSIASPNYIASNAILFMFYNIPYLLMTFLCATTGILIYCHHKKRIKLFVSQQNSDETRHIPKLSYSSFCNIAIMQFGFTVTLLPSFVIHGMLYSKHFKCSTLSKPYAATIYLSMTNGLVNVVVYSLRDKQFRIEIGKLFQFRCR